MEYFNIEKFVFFRKKKSWKICKSMKNIASVLRFYGCLKISRRQTLFLLSWQEKIEISLCLRQLFNSAVIQNEYHNIKLHYTFYHAHSIINSIHISFEVFLCSHALIIYFPDTSSCYIFLFFSTTSSSPTQSSLSTTF